MFMVKMKKNKLEHTITENAKFMHEVGDLLQYLVYNKHFSSIGYIESVRECSKTHGAAVDVWYKSVRQRYNIEDSKWK